MIDPLKAHCARELKVADAEIISAYHDKEAQQITVELRTGGKVLIDSSGLYRLDDNRANKVLPRWEGSQEPSPEPVVVTVDVGAPVVVGEPVGALIEEGHTDDSDVPDGTTNEVVVWVDGDKDRALAALEAERARAKPRVALIKQLERIADG